MNRVVECMGLFALLAMPLMMFLGIAICDVIICLIAGLFIMRSLMNQDMGWLKIRWVQIALVLWLYLIVISFYATVSVKDALSEAVPFGRFIFFAVGLQYWLLESSDNRRYLLYALLVALALMTLNTLFSFLTGLSLIGHSAIQYGHYHQIAWVWQRPYGRIMGINGKKSAGIMLTWVAMPAFTFLATWMHEKKGLSYFTALLSLLLLLFAITVTGDRMAFLECGFGYILLFILLPQLKWQLLLPAMIVLVLLLGAFILEPGLYERNITNLFQDTLHFSHDNYGAMLRTAMAIFHDHPIFGVGLKQYLYLSTSPQYLRFNGANTHAQNMYLEWLTGAGLLGTLLFLGIVFCWCQDFFRHRKLISVSPIAIGVLVAFMLRAWPFASTTSFFFSWGAITFWWMGAWLLAMCQ